jgi:NDP-sugar pyrophosphorylase family protein
LQSLKILIGVDSYYFILLGLAGFTLQDFNCGSGFALKAILLAGGYGTRLFPLTLRMPKVMVPVAGKPVLEHLLTAMGRSGIRDVVVSLNVSQKAIEQYFGRGERLGVSITYVYEDSQSDEDKFGAIGAIQYALSKTGGADECLVVNGDNIFYGLDIQKMREAHRATNGAATLALFSLSNPADAQHYGVVQVDKGGRILRFQEKPKQDEAVSRLASAGVYQLGSQFIKEYLPAYVEEHKRMSKKPDRVGDLWAYHLEKLPIYGHAFEGMWGDTNTPQTYINAHKQAMQFYVGDYAHSESGLQVTDANKVHIAKSAQVSPQASIRGPCIIEDEAVVEAGAVVGPCTHLGKKAVVGQNASVHGSVVFRGAKVGQRAHVTDSILDIASIVGDSAVVEEYSILGYKASLAANGRLTSNSRIWPLLEAGPGSVIGGDVLVSEKLIKEELKKDLLF